MTKIADNKITKNLLSSELKKMITLDNGFIYSDPEFLYELCKELKQNELTQYNYLKSISAVDYIEYFELVCHLDSMIYNTSIVIKTKIYGRNNLSVKSLTSLWKAQNYKKERFGI